MNNQEPVILAIESSCDDTSVAVLKGRKVLSNITATQLEHGDFGGVVPELASRAHMQNIVAVYNKAIAKAEINEKDIDAVAVTKGPGLLGSLLVGVSFGKSLALGLGKPIIEVHHMEAHILSHLIDDGKQKNPDFPFLCLTVSGGHTQLVLVESPRNFKLIGSTIDDAAGEAFDKIAKIIGLPYPGGPLIDKFSKDGDSSFLKISDPAFQDFDFSFSGMKTSVLYALQKEVQKNPQFIQDNLIDICASVQHTIVQALIKQSNKAIEFTKVDSFAIAGGVSANSGLRAAVSNMVSDNLNVFIPSFSYCTDNAAMIGVAGYYKYQESDFGDMSLSASARIPM
jgi:N6-L-threonylcarbamoyladenine synthase